MTGMAAPESRCFKSPRIMPHFDLPNYDAVALDQIWQGPRAGDVWGYE